MEINQEQWYTVRSIGLGYRVVVFDFLGNVLRDHIIYRDGHRHWKCSCPQGRRDDCRHRLIIRVFDKESRINQGWFYNYENQTWDYPIYHTARILKRNKERAHEDSSRVASQVLGTRTTR